MPIQRPLDFFTRMGPGDVLLAGHLERDGFELRVTPYQCQVAYDLPAPGEYRYYVTLPGKGSLDIAGVCTAYMPDSPTATFAHVVHSYDRASRTLEFRLLEQTNPPNPPEEAELQDGQRLYFWVHLYDSAPDRPNLVIEAP